MRPILRPPAPGKRPVVGIVAPASSAQQDRLDAGAANLAVRGWELRWMPHARGKATPYFSAGVQDRLEDLHAAFADPEIDLIVCTRGGYGSNYLLPGLDFERIARHPKPFFGYSDVTALQTAILDRTGLVSFHAPLLAGDFCRDDGVDEGSLRAILAGETYAYGANDGLRVLHPGVAEATLYGGCLSLLTASLGTPWAPETEGTLLFVEDVGARPYQVDRMLRQLLLAGKLEGVVGIVFGEMLDCVSPGAPHGLLEQAILHVLRDFAGPIVTGLRSGHVSRANLTLPLGLPARLVADADAPTLTLLEPAVSMRSSVRS